MINACTNCGSPVDIGGLTKSYGGYDVYCTICGHTFHVD